MNPTKVIYLFLFDTLSDWEIGYVTTGINNPMMQAEPGRYQLKTFSLDGQPITTMGGLKITPDISLNEVAPDQAAMLILPGGASWDEGKIQELADASQQKFVSDAKYVVAVVSDDSRLTRSYGERGSRYASQQAGAAIQNFLLALEEKGLVTCWVGSFADEQVKRVLGVSESMIVEALFPIGFETKIKTPKKFKQELESLIYFDKWGNKKMTPQSRVSQESS